MEVNFQLKPEDFSKRLERFWHLSACKIRMIDDGFDISKGSPVFTVGGKYTTRGWTEWTQGFQFGSEILQYDATGENGFLENGRSHTLERMAAHVSHTGVHDHGFNNLSTYGNLLRLMNESKIPFNEWEKSFYQLALKISGAVQASRWTEITDGGYIYSFNGPHSLFVDTIRSVRILLVSHLLGHFLKGENDRRISLLERAVRHIEATAKYSVFYGGDRDRWDERGRTAHESIFNVKDGIYRCPNSQQGFSGFTTWTRGLAWAMCGFAEELELFDSPGYGKLLSLNGISDPGLFRSAMLNAAMATCDFYLENTPENGIPYWDTGAPLLYKLGDYLSKPADPFNAFEPVDSSAASIGAQGLLRLGTYLSENGHLKDGLKYFQAGLTILDTLFDEPYLSTCPDHQGLILHSIYHQPNAWDHVPEGKRVPGGESSMWGDYHAREVALYLQRIIRNENYYTFFGCID